MKLCTIVLLLYLPVFHSLNTLVDAWQSQGIANIVICVELRLFTLAYMLIYNIIGWDFFYFFLLYFKVLILLDITPDQAMLNEGIAREVVNRIQKLRKKVPIASYRGSRYTQTGINLVL